MGIENITDKILSEANEEASRVLEKASKESHDKVQKAEQQAVVIRKDAETRGKEDSHLLKSRKVSVAELEARKMRLLAKQESISKSFDLALEKLANMDEAEYIKLLVKAISDTGVDSGELMLNQKDRDMVGQKVVGLVNDSKTSVGVTLSNETIDAKGGFVLKNGAVEINSTLETMVNSIRESVTPEVVKVLFH